MKALCLWQVEVLRAFLLRTGWRGLWRGDLDLGPDTSWANRLPFLLICEMESRIPVVEELGEDLVESAMGHSLQRHSRVCAAWGGDGAWWRKGRAVRVSLFWPSSMSGVRRRQRWYLSQGEGQGAASSPGSFPRSLLPLLCERGTGWCGLPCGHCE